MQACVYAIWIPNKNKWLKFSFWSSFFIFHLNKIILTILIMIELWDDANTLFNDNLSHCLQIITLSFICYFYQKCHHDSSAGEVMFWISGKSEVTLDIDAFDGFTHPYAPFAVVLFWISMFACVVVSCVVIACCNGTLCMFGIQNPRISMMKRIGLPACDAKLTVTYLRCRPPSTIRAVPFVFTSAKWSPVIKQRELL